MLTPDSILTHTSDGLYANTYLQSVYPRPEFVRWARKKITGYTGLFWSYLIAIAPNLVNFILHPLSLTWDHFDKLLIGLVHIIIPTYLLNSEYILLDIIIVIGAVATFLWARQDEKREKLALKAQEDRAEAQENEAIQARQQEEINHLIEGQLGRRWYGGSSVVASLPDQMVEAQPADLALLPPASPNLLGRADDIQWLLDRLYPKPSRVIALYGESGMGKSSVIAKAMETAKDRFPDGIAIVDCSSTKSALRLLTIALARFAPVGVAASDEAGLPEVARRILRGNRILIILDNVPATIEGLDRLIDPLRNADITVLAVARKPLDEEIFPIGSFHTLHALSAEDSLAVLKVAAGDQARQQSVATVAPLFHGNPLALVFVGQYARATGRPLEDIARELTEFVKRTTGQSHAISVASVVAYLYERLPRPAQQLFMELAAHPTMSLSRRMATDVARQILHSEKDSETALNTLIAWGLLTEGEQKGVGLNIFTPTPVRDLASQRFESLDKRKQSHAIKRIERLYIAAWKLRENKFASLTEVVQSPDQQAYLRMIRRANAIHAVGRLVTLCEAAAEPWRNKYQYEALLVYLPIGLRAIDNGRASRLPWKWLWYRLPHMRQRYYRLLYYYADSLRDVGKTQYARVVFKRSLNIARFQHDDVHQADVYGGLGAVALTEAQQSEDIQNRTKALEKSHRLFKRVETLLKPLAPSETSILTDRHVVILRDLANAYVGLARISLMSKDKTPEERRAEAKSLDEQGLALIAKVARQKPDEFDDTLALLYSDLGDLARDDKDKTFAEAARYYHHALAHMSAQSNPSRWIEVTRNLIYVESQRKDTSLSKKSLETSIARWEKLGDELREGLARAMLGGLLIDQGDFDDGQKHLEKAIALLLRAGDREHAAEASLNLGISLSSQGDLTRARDAYRDSLITFREATNKWGTSSAFMYLGELLLQQGIINDAEDLFTEARHIAVKGNDRESEASILLDLGRVAMEQAKYDLARSYFQEAYDIFQWGDMPRAALIALLWLAEVARLRNEFSSAHSYIDQAETIARSDMVKSDAALADVMRERGDIFYMVGDIAKAKRLLDAARKKYDDQRNPIEENAAVITLGLIALDHGDTKEAQELLGQATKLYHQTDTRVAEGLGLLSQGRVALAMGNLEKKGESADHFFNAANEKLRETEARSAQGLAKTWLGWLAFLRAQFDDAAHLLEDGYELAQKTADTRNQVTSLVFQAEMENARGAPTAALKAAREAVALAHSSVYPHGEGLAQSALASIFTRTGDIPAAFVAVNKALRLLDKVEARPAYALARCRKANILATRGDAAAALIEYQTALARMQGVTDQYTLALITRDMGAWLESQQPGSQEAAALRIQSERIAHDCGFHFIKATSAATATPVNIRTSAMHG